MIDKLTCTDEMLAAWVAYEPPAIKKPITILHMNGHMRTAFFAGYQAGQAPLLTKLAEARDNLEYAGQMLEEAGNDAGAGFCERQVVKFSKALRASDDQ